jgi:hypothetical protein
VKQLFLKKHEAFHAMREVVEGKSMAESDWVILRLLMAGRATAAVTKKDYVLSILYLLKKYKSAVVFDCIKRLQEEKK